MEEITKNECVETELQNETDEVSNEELINNTLTDFNNLSEQISTIRELISNTKPISDKIINSNYSTDYVKDMGELMNLIHKHDDGEIDAITFDILPKSIQDRIRKIGGGKGNRQNIVDMIVNECRSANITKDELEQLKSAEEEELSFKNNFDEFKEEKRKTYELYAENNDCVQYYDAYMDATTFKSLKEFISKLDLSRDIKPHKLNHLRKNFEHSYSCHNTNYAPTDCPDPSVIIPIAMKHCDLNNITYDFKVFDKLYVGYLKYVYDNGLTSRKIEDQIWMFYTLFEVMGLEYLDKEKDLYKESFNNLNDILKIIADKIDNK